MEQARLENERRKEEREHELKIFSMMISSINQSCQNSTTPTSTFSQPFANVEQQTNIGNSYTDVMLKVLLGITWMETKPTLIYRCTTSVH